MLTFRYTNGMQDVLRTGQATPQRFLDHVPTLGANPSGAEQGQIVPGYLDGNAWNLYNTGFREINKSMPLGGSYENVVFRMYFQQRTVSSPGTTFLRFEGGANKIQISLRMNSSRKLEVWRGGTGGNLQVSGSRITEIGTPFTLNTWYGLEVRIRFNAAGVGTIAIWVDDALLFSTTTTTAYYPTLTCDRVTLRAEMFALAGSNQYWDHVMIATDDTAGATRIGPAKVSGILATADYAIDSGWVPNGGTHHFDRFADNSISGQTPDEAATRLDGTEASGDDLFTVTQPSCDGAIRAVSINLSSFLVAGSARIQPRIFWEGSVLDFGQAYTPLTTRWKIDQAVMTLNPSGDPWSDQQIFESAFGFKGLTPAGAVRVSMMFLEKVVMLDGSDYECGGLANYII